MEIADCVMKRDQDPPDWELLRWVHPGSFDMLKASTNIHEWIVKTAAPFAKDKQASEAINKAKVKLRARNKGETANLSRDDQERGFWETCRLAHMVRQWQKAGKVVLPKTDVTHLNMPTKTAERNDGGKVA
ncbi:hypothetical protein LTR09_009109 [Extremus antarcticus]|uniref:Uncharacterized protein n=1 Tax=Extremus antarcticus TaxID=702011 RepID=A0AAJ0GC18_9PEZI|nr:hypothetical protein LTR09_009109 [Extremus antarcticus]